METTGWCNDNRAGPVAEPAVAGYIALTQCEVSGAEPRDFRTPDNPVPRSRLRPSLLDPLFAPATTLPGVGPKTAKALDKLLGDETRAARVIDLLFRLPTGEIGRASCRERVFTAV